MVLGPDSTESWGSVQPVPPITKGDAVIKAGDLVMVVGSSLCAGSADVGYIFLVAGIIPGDPNTTCNYCGQRHRLGELGALERGKPFWWPLRRLRKIPPLSELEGTSVEVVVGKRKENVEAR